MRSFTPGFAAEVDRTRGAKPLWILSITASDTIRYLSDVAVTIPAWNGGCTTLGWISSWGEISEQMSGDLNEIRVADFSVSCIVDPDTSPNINDLCAMDIESEPCRLYLWYLGLNPATDPPFCFFTGYIRDVSGDNYTVRLDMDDGTSRLEGTVGTIATASQFPDIDPGDVGKLLPIVYGSVQKLPTIAIDSGPSTTLAELIIGDTTFSVTDAAHLSAGDTIQIDDEQITIGTVSGNTLDGCNRGANSTLITGHALGATVIRHQSTFAYLAAGHAVNSIDRVYGSIGGKIIDISPIPGIVKYTGQSGSQHSSWPGYAVITIPERISLNDARQLVADTSGLTLTATGWSSDKGSLSVATLVDLLDSISVAQGSHSHPSVVAGTATIVFDNAVTVSGNYSWYWGQPYLPRLYDGDAGTFTGGAVGWSPTATARRLSSFSNTYTPLRIRIKYCGSSNDNSYGPSATPLVQWVLNGVKVLEGLVGGSARWYTSGWYAISNWADVNAANTYVNLNFNANYGQCIFLHEIYYEVEYGIAGTGPSSADGVAKIDTVSVNSSLSTQSGNPTLNVGSITQSGVVTITGDSAANTMIADTILCDVTGLYSSPVEVASNLLSYAGFAAATVSGTMPTGYSIDGAITAQGRLIDWLCTIAFQCRCFFRMVAGEGKLFVRPDAMTSAKTISAVAVDSGRALQSWRRAPLTQIVNSISVRYQRDWSNGGGEPYRAISNGTDATSIDRYGTRTNDTLFRLDFVTSQTMADSLVAFYLAQYATRRTYVDLMVYLDQLAVEFGDAITTPDLLTGVVVSSGVQPGSIEQMDKLKLTVMV